MPQDRTRKIVIAGVLGAISIFLGLTGLGFIPWVTGTPITVLAIPAIIGAVLEGPVVGFAIGLIFGVFSLIQAPSLGGLTAIAFTNPLVSILPRLFIGPLAWLAWKSLRRWQAAGLIAAGIVGSLTNTILVLGMLGLLYSGIKVGTFELTWAYIGTTFVVNGLPEAVVSALITLAVVAALRQIQFGRKKGANLE